MAARKALNPTRATSKRKALLAAAAAVVAGTGAYYALRSPPKTIPLRPTTQIVEKVSAAPQPPKPNGLTQAKPSELTWAEAIKKIEADAKQRVQEKAADSPPPAPNPFSRLTAGEFAYRLAQHEAETLQTHTLGDDALSLIQSLPILRPDIYNRIDYAFNRDLKLYFQGKFNESRIPVARASLEELVNEIGTKFKGLSERDRQQKIHEEVMAEFLRAKGEYYRTALERERYSGYYDSGKQTFVVRPFNPNKRDPPRKTTQDSYLEMDQVWQRKQSALQRQRKAEL
ncbi:MAG: hypothetical protein V1722_02905 [Candidatus Micrarchaeota archaeon]